MSTAWNPIRELEVLLAPSMGQPKKFGQYQIQSRDLEHISYYKSAHQQSPSLPPSLPSSNNIFINLACISQPVQAWIGGGPGHPVAITTNRTIKTWLNPNPDFNVQKSKHISHRNMGKRFKSTNQEYLHVQYVTFSAFAKLYAKHLYRTHLMQQRNLYGESNTTRINRKTITEICY